MDASTEDGERANPSAALIARIWWEVGAEQALRARLTGIGRDGVSHDIGAVAGRQELLAAVGAWVDHFVAEIRDINNTAGFDSPQ